MARSLLHLANSLFAVLLFTVEASGSLLTLANFESISTASLPLGCVLAYKTPLRGCSMKDFGEGSLCSSTCQQGIMAVEKNIQDSCVLVSIGSNSLLDQAQRGGLVIAICGNKQPPTTARTSSSISFPRPGTFSKIPFDTPPPTFSSTTTKPEPASTTSATPSPTMMSTLTSTTASTSDDNSDVSTPTPTITSIATTSRTQEDSTEVQVSTTSTATTLSTDEPTPRRTQPPGGGGSPFDFVPGDASQRSLDLSSKILAVLFFAVAMYVN